MDGEKLTAHFLIDLTPICKPEPTKRSFNALNGCDLDSNSFFNPYTKLAILNTVTN